MTSSYKLLKNTVCYVLWYNTFNDSDVCTLELYMLYNNKYFVFYYNMFRCIRKFEINNKFTSTYLKYNVIFFIDHIFYIKFCLSTVNSQFKLYFFLF